MKIYISSSWKNRVRVREIATLLRVYGHEVYDFTDPKCRLHEEIPPEKFPVQFDPDKHLYCEYIMDNPYWHDAVMDNQEALKRCDLVILLLPCGNDAHADWAYAVGLGKKSIVIGSPVKGDRTPSHMWADAIMQDDMLQVLSWIHKFKSYQ